MKTIRIAMIIVAVAASAAAAEYVNRAGQISGTNSYSAAAYSGARSSGDYVTTIGNSAFRQSAADNSVAVGALSTALSGGNDQCVMVGNWSGYGSSNLCGCVGIGAGAFIGANAMTNCTVINGHFNVDGIGKRFWITPDRTDTANWDGCPPIYYEDGILYLNARHIVKRTGAVESYAPLWTSDWTLAASNSIYVSEYGNDADHGLSAYYPKRTLQAAILAVSDDVTTIYLDRGVYESPEYLNGTISSTAHPLNIVGIGRRDEIVIDCANARKMSAGSSGPLCRIANATIRNPKTPSVNLSDQNRGALQLLYLENCRIEGTNVVVRNTAWPFCACILKSCDVDMTVNVPAAVNSSAWYGTLIYCGALVDTTMKVRTSSTYAANIGYAVDTQNCYIDIDKVNCLRISIAGWATSHHSEWIDTTLIVGSADSWDSGGNATNCVFGYGDDGPGDNFSNWSYRTSATNLTARLAPATHRPAMSDFDLVPYGYNSAANRAVRAAAAATVIDALAASDTVTEPQRALLGAKRAQLVERNSVEPLVLPYWTNSVTVVSEPETEGE